MLTNHTVAIYTAYAHKLPKARPELLELLLENDNSIVVFGLEDQEIGDNAFKSLGIKYYSIPISRHGLSIGNEICGAKIIANGLLENKASVLLTYGIRLVLSANRAAQMVRIPVVNTINGAGTLFADQSIKGSILRKMLIPVLKHSFAKSYKAIFQNEDDLQEFTKLGLVEKEKCLLTNGSGVNLQKYTFADLPEEPIFGFDCRLSKEKGVRELLEAFYRLKADYPAAKLHIAGCMDGIEKTDISDLFNKAITDKEIEYYGEISDINAFLHDCKCFVYPSYYREGVPRSNLEALACGRPIITTDMPGCRDTVQDGANGFVVPPRNTNALYEAMVKICELNGDCINMGIRSRQIAEKRFDVNMNNQRICECLEQSVQ